MADGDIQRTSGQLSVLPQAIGTEDTYTPKAPVALKQIFEYGHSAGQDN
jgi:hypothetical protein